MIAAVACVVISGSLNRASGQLVSDDIFLKGKYLEVGIGPNGCFGSQFDAPTGYHPRPASTTSGVSTGSLGFVADPDKDGWTVGAIPYYGDYFLPSLPLQNWAIEINGSKYIVDRYINKSAGFPAGLTGGNYSYYTAGATRHGLWQGSVDSLAISKDIYLDTNALHFVVKIKFRNTKKSATLKRIYYAQSVNADNDVASGTLDTKDSVIFQTPNPENKSLVISRGATTNSYLGLGAKDCRAKVFRYTYNFTDFTPYSTVANSLSAVFNETGSVDHFYSGGKGVANDFIGIIFNVDSLKAGDSTTIAYTYILKQEYLDSAFTQIKSSWLSGTTQYNSKDTVTACAGSSIPVAINNGDDYNWGAWTPTTGLSATSGTTNTITVGTTVVTYQVIGTSKSSACTLNDTLYLTIKPVIADTPAATIAYTYCQGVTAPALTATGTNLKWYTVASGGTASAAAPVPSTTATGTKSYWVSQTVSIAACESPRTKITVTVNPTPAAPAVTTPVNYCTGEATTALTATKGSPSDTLIWQTGTAGLPGIVAPVPNSATASSTDYYVSLKTALGCEGPKSLIKVNINARPAAPVVVTPAKLCNGYPVTALKATGTNLKWYTADTGGTGSSTAPSPSTATIGSSTAYVSQTSGAGCEGLRAKITIDVQPTPKLLISPLGIPDFIFCEGRTVTLRAITPTGVTYQWQTAGTAIPGATLDTFSTGTKGYYGVTVTNIYGCKITDSVLVKPNTLPAPVLSPTDVQICEGVNIRLYATPASTGYLYEWIKDGVFLPVPVTENNTYVNQSGTYSVRVTDIYTCVKMTNESNVSTYPTVLKPSIIRLDPILRLSRPYARYQWYRNNKPIAGATAATYKLLYDGNYFAEVSDVNSCYNYSDTITVNALSIKENNTNEIALKIYPNPTQDIVNIEAPVAVNVRVTDVVGKVILESKDAHSINLNQYADGTYFLQISDQDNNIIALEKINKISSR